MVPMVSLDLSSSIIKALSTAGISPVNFKFFLTLFFRVWFVELFLSSPGGGIAGAAASDVSSEVELGTVVML